MARIVGNARIGRRDACLRAFDHLQEMRAVMPQKAGDAIDRIVMPGLVQDAVDIDAGGAAARIEKLAERRLGHNRSDTITPPIGQPRCVTFSVWGAVR